MSLILESNRSDSESLRMEEDVDDVNTAHHSPSEPPPVMAVHAESSPFSSLPEPPAPIDVTPEVVPQPPSEESLQVSKDFEMEDVTEHNYVAMDQAEAAASLVSIEEINRLRNELLMEETKLILMKKMYHLQNMPLKPEKKDDAVPERKALSGQKFPASTSSALFNGQRHAKGQPEVASGRNDKNNSKDPKMQSLMKGASAPHNQRSAINVITPAVLELSKSLAHKQPLTKAQPNVTSHQGQNVSSRSQSTSQRPQPHPLDVLEQQLSAEKMALKRQMEKSVLQITAPKAPLPDLNFIPGTVCPDFVALLGMELAASYAIKSQNIVDRGRSSEPYLCVKCGEDVCQTWKKDVDSGAVVCEPCFMTCRSQAARLTHIENLKLGFADVLEKEREMDRLHAAALSKAKAANLVENIAPQIPYPLPVAPPQKAQRQPKVSHNQNSNNHTNSRREVPVDRQMDRGMRASPNVARPNGPTHNHREPPVYHNSSRSTLPPAPRNSVSKPPLTSPFAPVATPQPYAPSSSSSSKHAQYLQNSNNMQRHSAERQYLLDMISRAPKPNNPAVPNAWRK